jgi:hypothetical protein
VMALIRIIHNRQHSRASPTAKISAAKKRFRFNGQRPARHTDFTVLQRS